MKYFVDLIIMNPTRMVVKNTKEDFQASWRNPLSRCYKDKRIRKDCSTGYKRGIWSNMKEAL